MYEKPRFSVIVVRFVFEWTIWMSYLNELRIGIDCEITKLLKEKG